MNDLERSLFALADKVDWPEGADITGSVRAAIEKPAPRSFVSRRALGYAALLALLVGFALLVVSPGMRTAVADFLGIGGVRIDTSGSPTPTPADRLDLGRSVSLTEAGGSVGYEVRVPTALGEPDGVFLDTAVEGGQVALAYEATNELPASPGTDLGALLTQFPEAEVAETALKKVTGEGTTFEPVSVGGEPGFWISGEPHVIAYLEPDGDVRNEAVRLAGNVLLWESDDVTYRLESRLSKADALAIAESLE
jgi:hypothetical protein